ncbi:hypothetical protein Tco_1562691 [Tanacetum coccineum]
MSASAIEELITQCVAIALADYKANQNSGKGNGNGNGSHDSGSGGGRTSHPARVCTYKEFLNCQPLNFKGAERVVILAHWFEKMEYVFHISNCTVECQVKMILDETDKLERYVGGLPDNIQGSVMASKPKILLEAIKFVRSLMDQKGLYDGPSEKKEYAGTLPLCNKCKLHYNGLCTLKHYLSECPGLKNQNCGNQTGNDEAHGWVYALGGGEANQDPDNIADDIEA